jgi:uncharacterized protein (DUF433 family)
MAKPPMEPPPGFDDLSVEEKIEYVNALWDRILRIDRADADELYNDFVIQKIERGLADADAGRVIPHEVVKQLIRITHDPEVMGGQPCIRGMRVTVGTVVGLLAAGRSEAEILESYPYLEREDIAAALAHAAWRSQEIDLAWDADEWDDLKLIEQRRDDLEANPDDSVSWEEVREEVNAKLKR